MSFHIEPIRAKDINDVVTVMNESSDGFSFQFQLNPIKFLTLSSFWNFSYEHSYIAFVDRHPAGVVIDSVDKDAREGYTFYWGIRSPFRKTTLSLKLLMTYLNQIAGEGFRWTHGDTSPDSPHSIYERLGFEIRRETLQMECLEPYSINKEEIDESFIQEISLEEFLDASDCLRREAAAWIQRPGTIRRASPFLRFVKCSNIYVAYQPHSEGSVVIDLKWQESDRQAMITLMSHIARTSVNGQCKFSYVPLASSLAKTLAELGFTITNRATSLALDLHRWQPRQQKQ